MLFENVDRPKRRALLFVVSIAIRTFGMALTIKAGLGASPSSSVPYAAFLVFPELPLAVYATSVSIVEVVIQKILYRQYMSNLQMAVQIIISFLFGYLLDAFNALLGFMNPTEYAVQIVIMILGCAVMGFGVYVELIANFTMLTGDGMNRAIAYKTGIKYGYVKMATDIILVLIAVSIGIIGVGSVEGIREGTIAAAILVGPFVNLFNKCLKKLSVKLMPPSPDGRGEQIGLSF